MVVSQKETKLMLSDATVKKALALATKYHKGQTRWGGEPYITHPIRIAEKFSDMPVLQCIALLHDVIEDTPCTIQMLEKAGFDADIILAVDALSKRKKEPYLDYVLRVKKVIFALPVKLADLDDNLSDIERGSLRDKYVMAKYILEN